MEELIERIRARLKDGAYPNEAAVSFSILMPILRLLGWDDSDPDQVIPEHASGGRRVDFALCGAPRRPSIFIEVKGVGRAIEGDRQLFEYAFHEGIPLCVLTDGRDWSFYLPGGQGSYNERRVYRLQLNERPPSESARVLHRYLDRERVKSGDALEDATRDYRDIASRREALRSLPEAWSELVEEPEDLLVELLSDQTEAVSGFRPSSDEAIGFLRSLRHAANPEAQPAPGHTGPAVSKNHDSTTRLESSMITGPSKSLVRTVEYTLFGREQAAPNASAALVEILSEVARLHPNKIDEIAASVRGRSRNHIARTVAEIYPARPDLARAVEFTPGWLVGLNIANREKMRIIQAACRAIGAQFGKDVAIELPNA